MDDVWSIRSAKATALAESRQLRDDALLDHIAHLVAAIDLRDGAWLDDAACAGIPAGDAIFFPTVRRTGIYNRAETICVACPVALPCLAAWLHHHPHETRDWGYAGCTTPTDRARLRPHLAVARSAA